MTASAPPEQPQQAAEPQLVVIVGQGYVGLPVAMRAVEVGHRVIGVDADRARVKALNAGESHVEDVPSAVVAAAIDSGRYQATADAPDCAGFDVAVICVPTPLAEGVPDLSFIEAAGQFLAPSLTRGATVILESTTYPGTTEELLVPILEAGSELEAGRDFHVGYSPERIDPGNREYTLVNTPKVVSGIDAASLATVKGFYDSIVERTVPVGSPKVAELTKLLENTFRHVNVALVNELAVFAYDLGIDVWEAIDAASTKPFGYLRFTPGPGVGGHCLPIDPSYLSWRVRRQLHRPFRFIELANDINEEMPQYVVQRLMLALNREGKALRGAQVLLLGLAYKRNTGDARESPSISVAQRLVPLGADVRAADPYVRPYQVPDGVTLVDFDEREVAEADAVIVLTDHDCFDYELVGRRARFVLDTRRRITTGPVEIL